MRKSNYWQKRIQEQEEKALSRTQKETQAALAEIYKQCGTDLREEIAEVFSKIQGDKKAGEVLPNDYYRNVRYWRLLDRINELLKSLGEKQIEITKPAILALYSESLSNIEENIPSSFVEGSFLNTGVVDGEQALFQAWCLDGKTFSDRVWDDKTKMLEEFKKQLNTCIVQGKSPWDAAKQVSDRLSVSRSNAYRLMRTECAHAQIYAQTKRYKELGFTQGDWDADSCSCPHCKEQDGKKYPLDRIRDMIPAHPNCRCSYNVVVI